MWKCNYQPKLARIQHWDILQIVESESTRILQSKATLEKFIKEPTTLSNFITGQVTTEKR